MQRLQQQRRRPRLKPRRLHAPLLLPPQRVVRHRRQPLQQLLHRVPPPLRQSFPLLPLPPPPLQFRCHLPPHPLRQHPVKRLPPACPHGRRRVEALLRKQNHLSVPRRKPRPAHRGWRRQPQNPIVNSVIHWAIKSAVQETNRTGFIATTTLWDWTGPCDSLGK
ncbi:hypothetical protein V8G54_010860 [Vigna mungo]|uniref:Uncharacterized protein n=1 Tax=Vigna mungo TaxID=3915 RepID=A0AAQ3NY85_VIGMU